MPEYNKLRDKYNNVENLIHLSGESSESLSSLIHFFGSDTAKVDPCGWGGLAVPGIYVRPVPVTSTSYAPS